MDKFQGEILPESCQLVGYSWLVSHFFIKSPVRELSCISSKRLSSKRESRKKWIVFDSQLQFEESIGSHFEFALKHERLDVLLIKKILEVWEKNEIEKYIRLNVTSLYRRKIWFYYEYLFNAKLAIADIDRGNYADLVDTKKYFTKTIPINSKRHKIKNNLLGTRLFCPLIRRTKELEVYINKGLQEKSNTLIGEISSSVLKRAASFLLLSDSQASFEIEGEKALHRRIERWGKIVSEAGKNDLSVEEIERLHSELIQDKRFIKIGLRKEGVFLGERDINNNPIPEFIGAKEDDLEELIEGWIELNQLLSSEKIDPILHSVIIAFSFIYIHPLEDGNGRIHRYLLHHVLRKQNFYKSNLIFPISSVILDSIEKYRHVLVSHTAPIMDCIDWDVTRKLNIKVTNNTIDLYRYFDCTEACEFIYECAERTIQELLPKEITYLESFDKSFADVEELIEMADHEIKQLLTFVIQNQGKLSKRKKDKFYEKLTDSEQSEIENIVSQYFDFTS